MLIVSRIFRGLNLKELGKNNNNNNNMLPFLHLFWVDFLNCFHICLLSEPGQLITITNK